MVGDQEGYLKGEERFGYVLSFSYLLFTKIGSYKKFAMFVAKDITNSNVNDVIDIGTGPASIPLLISKLSKNKINIYAVDPSKQMVFISKKRTRRYSNIKIDVGSSRGIPFIRKFDIIFSSLSFHHWKKKEGSIRYLLGFLKKGGEIRLYEYNKDRLARLHAPVSSHSVTKEELETLAKNCKLHITVKVSGEFILAILTK